MLRPIVNPKLSLRARSLFYYFVEKGRVISADELRTNAEVLEGRDAIQAAINELKDLKYVKSVRVQNNGQWVSKLKFTEEAKKLISTDNGFSGHLYIDNYTVTSTSSLSTSTNIDTDTNVSVSIGAAPLKEEEVVWNLDGDEQPKKPKRGEEDDVTGAVGKVTDRQARLNAKYKRTKAEEAGKHRSNTPEELWSTNDLVAEFYSLVEAAAPGVPAQVNSQYVATWINKQVGEGTPRLAILEAMRMFFADPRLTHDAGIGKPLWQRFFAYYPTVHGIVTKPKSKIYEDEEFQSHQEKMLKLLGGE
jgi:hypothetical protein